MGGRGGGSGRGRGGGGGGGGGGESSSQELADANAQYDQERARFEENERQEGQALANNIARRQREEDGWSSQLQQIESLQRKSARQHRLATLP